MSNLELESMQSKQGRTRSIHGLAGGKFVTVAVGIILLLTTIVYANSIHNDFTNWDDLSLVVENPAIRSLSIDNLIDIFTPKPGKTYQPVRVLSYAIDYSLWKLNPLGYHLGNIALHGFSAVILYLLLASLLNQIRPESSLESTRLIALSASLLFAVHPVNVEAVTWISSRKYGLLAFFYFSSFYFYIKTSAKGRYHRIYYTLSIVSYVLSLLSSPFSVTLPAILFLYDYCRIRDINPYTIIKSHLLSYLPYIVLSISQFIILWNSFTTTPGPEPAIKSHEMDSIFYTFLTMSRVLYDYMKNLILPFWLNNMYVDYTSTSLLEYKVILSLLIIFFLLGILFFQVRAGNKVNLFCFGWFILTWLPVSNIIPISTKMADRYLYLPAVGLFLFFSLAVYNISHRLFSRKARQLVTVPLMVFLVFSLSYLSIARNRVWANSQTLWEDSLRKAPAYWVPHMNLGLTMAQQGRIEEAISYYRESLRLNPNSVHTHNNLGVVLLERGQISDAIGHYVAALRLKSDYAETYNNLGVALFRLGDFDKAIAQYREALRLDPDFGKAHNNLGNALVEQDRFAEAIFHYSKALETKAHYPEAHNNLGAALAQQGKLNEAIIQFESALRLKPDYAQARVNLKTAMQMLEKTNKTTSKGANP
ncbi:MAG: tetratricopeptide repeat protein [Syntrophobacterales bacterium]|jgi:tetratricopeptide (TPR) repeat protein